MGAWLKRLKRWRREQEVDKVWAIGGVECSGECTPNWVSKGGLGERGRVEG